MADGCRHFIAPTLGPPPARGIERIGRCRALSCGLQRSMVAHPPDAEATLVQRLRRSRLRAREAAVAEVVALLRGLGAHSTPGGPLSEVGGVAWVALPASNLLAASQ